eukprot:1114410-Rhodomonas_salina.2
MKAWMNRCALSESNPRRPSSTEVPKVEEPRTPKHPRSFLGGLCAADSLGTCTGENASDPQRMASSNRRRAMAE